MQEQMNTTPVEPMKRNKARAQKKHVVLFSVACVILVVSILGLVLALVSLQNSMPTLPQSPDSPPDAALPGAEILGVFVVMLTYAMATTFILLLCAFAWGLGMLLSARLAFCKHDKPKWLWICSCILTAVFTVLVVVSLGLIAYVLIVLFVF